MIYYIINFIFSKYKMLLQEGDGFFERTAGKLSPKIRKLLEQVGDEKITSIKLFRKPISLSSFAKFIGALKGTAYDELLHLGLILNNKYLLDKQEVIHFERSGVPSGAETLDVEVDKDITINELLERTRSKMGDSNFTSYSSRRNNCQDFVQAVLSANGLSSPIYTKFIKQDTESVFKNLPSYAEKLSDFVTGAQRVVEKIVQGEGASTKMYNYQLHEAKCKF
jgi:hypothetical protein